MRQSTMDNTASVEGTADFSIAGIGAGEIFLPGSDPEATKLLLECLWRQRQTSFVAGAMTILRACPEIAEETGFAIAFNAWRQTPAAPRRTLMEHPCFRIWLNRMIRLPRLDRMTEADRTSMGMLLSDGTRLIRDRADEGLALHRFYTDPLLASAIPPSYEFDGLEAKQRHDAANPYSLSFANKVITAALDAIAGV